MRIFRGRKRLLYSFIGLLLLAVAAIWFCTRTTPPPLPEGVRLVTRTLTLTGTPVQVDIYLPHGLKEAPLAIVAHGFSRSRRYMAGWGGKLAQQGFIAAVLDQPWWLAHVRNGRVICGLAEEIRAGKLELGVSPTSKTVLVGMSMGGLTTLLAANLSPVDAWVGLDPVDVSGAGVIAAPSLTMPSAIFCAEANPWNMDNSARQIQNALSGPVFTLQIHNSTHCDSEWPTDILGQIACGRASDERRQIYERYAMAFLRSVIFADTAAAQVVASAAKDDRVTVLQKEDP